MGVFGGTFDPVHRGHVASIVELRDRLGLSRVLVVPAGNPPHRRAPASSGVHRLAMLHLALDGASRIEIDERELNREGRSFMVDTLASIRAELPADEPLVFAMGMDAYLTLPTWHRWEELTRFAHIVALARPGAKEAAPPEIRAWEAGRLVTPEVLLTSAAGAVARLELSQLDVSATEVRSGRASGSEWRSALTPAVADYIEMKGLYQRSSATAVEGSGDTASASHGVGASTINPA